MMLKVVGDAFTGQADSYVRGSPFYDLVFLAFGKVEGDTVADAKGGFIGIDRHDRTEVTQGTEQKVDGRQAAGGDFVDKTAAEVGES